jgi:hypothetical protein
MFVQDEMQGTKHALWNTVSRFSSSEGKFRFSDCFVARKKAA